MRTRGAQPGRRSRRLGRPAALWWAAVLAAATALPACAGSRAALDRVEPAAAPADGMTPAEGLEAPALPAAAPAAAGPATEQPPAPPTPAVALTTSAPPADQPPPPPEPPTGAAPPPTPESPPATPPGAPAPPGESGGFLEPAFPGQPTPGRVIVTAQEVYWDQGVTQARGGVTLRSTQYTLQADEAELDEKQEWATLRGNIVLQGKYVRTRGQAVRVNLKTGAWTTETQVAATVEPEFFSGGQVAEPLFVRAQEASSTQEQGPIVVRRGEVTSCSLERPHYAFASRRIEIRPGKTLIVERPGIYALGHRLLQLPFDLVLSLEQRRWQQYLPAVGRNDVEGFFAKFAFGYLVGQAAAGVVRLSLTEKRGVGLGLEQDLTAGGNEGVGSLMYEPQEGSLTGRLQDRYKLSPEWTTDLTGSYQANSGYFGNTSSLATSALLSRRTGSGALQLGWQRSLTTSSFGTNQRSTTSLDQRQRWGSEGDWSVRASLEDSSYGGSALPTRSLVTQMQINRRAGSFDLSLLADDREDLDLPAGGQPRFALNRLPLLTVSTDNRRLGRLPLVGSLLGDLPYQAELSVGNYQQQPENLQVMRYGLDLRLGGERRPWGRRAQSRASGRFLQAYYGDGSAQFIVAANWDLQQDLGGQWYQRLRYNHQERQGFAPISVDYAGRQDNLWWQLVQARTDRSRLELSTGYDLVGSFWQDVRLAAEYMPSRSTKLTLQGGYDLRNSRARPLGLVWTHVRPSRLYLTLATEYDPGGAGLQRVSTELDWAISQQWQIALAGAYSGFSRQLETLDVQITRDLHCLTATLGYSRELDQISFALGIKAFPSPEQAFGIGRSGQQFQALPGQYY